MLWHGVVFADGFDATVFQERYVTAMGSTKQDMLAAELLREAENIDPVVAQECVK
jgi:hypothetical protein